MSDNQSESAIQLLDVKITKVNYTFNTSVQQESSELTIKHKVHMQDIKDENAMLIGFGLSISTERDLLSIDAIIEGLFKFNHPVTDEVKVQAAKINAPAILYPYLRAMISSITSQAGIPPLVLPIVNFVALNLEFTIDVFDSNAIEQIAKPVIP